ncbi:hypothetical protein ACYATP_01580 [Lactobacillaceae bacterium Melli_B4]
MSTFEGLHPIMTAHYTLDWLTQFKVKDVDQLRKTLFTDQTDDPSDFINSVMRKVMDGDQLWWAISDKQGQLIGLVVIDDLTNSQVNVNYQIIPAAQSAFNADEVKASVDSLLAGINHQVGQWKAEL